MLGIVKKLLLWMRNSEKVMPTLTANNATAAATAAAATVAQTRRPSSAFCAGASCGSVRAAAAAFSSLDLAAFVVHILLDTGV
jgi:hypothetical protein